MTRTVHLPDLSDPTVHVGVATSYSFRWKWGWAIYTINDGTGEFSVQSDWGNWCYRWSTDPANLAAPNLTAFLARMNDPYYVADKFHYGRRNERLQYDEDATKRTFMLMVGDEYRDGKIDLERARELVDLLKNSVDWDSEESYIRTFYDDFDTLKVLTEEPYMHTVTGPTASYTILVDALLPFFFNYLRCEVVNPHLPSECRAVVQEVAH